jgi:hypothetical protein
MNVNSSLNLGSLAGAAYNPADEWLRMQAISFVGRTDVTVEQAVIIWLHYDIHTRKELPL